MADTVPPESPFVSGPGRTPNLFLAAIIMLAIFIVGSLIYLFGGSIGNLLGFTAFKEATPVTETEIAAFRLARQMVNDYSDSKLLDATNIEKSRIELVFLGKVVSLEEGKQWTIEKNGKTVVLNAGSLAPVEYTKKIKGEKERSVVNASDIKNGDEVYIRTGIDFDKGTMYVIRILIITEPVSQPQEPAI